MLNLFGRRPTGFLLLDVEAEELGPADAGHPLLLLDSTWRYLPQLQRCLRGEPHPLATPELRSFLLRMLAAVACSDSPVGAIEREFLLPFADGEFDVFPASGFRIGNKA